MQKRLAVVLLPPLVLTVLPELPEPLGLAPLGPEPLLALPLPAL
jgi:hypothetical protein